jgi:hypothetical protein
MSVPKRALARSEGSGPTGRSQLPASMETGIKEETSMLNIGSTDGIARRREYNEIVAIGDVPAERIVARFKDALPDRYCSFDRRGRGDALNLDLYGFDKLATSVRALDVDRQT